MRSLPIPDVAPNERLNGLVANLGMHSTEVFGRLVAHRLEIGRSVVRSGQLEVFLKPAKLREKIEGDRLAEPLDQPSLISARDRRHAPAGPHDECVAQELGIRTHNSRLPAVATPRQYEASLCQVGVRGRVEAARWRSGVGSLSGPGVTDPKCRCQGASRPRWIEESPLIVLPGPLVSEA
jgi:hypothetical protein